MCRKAIERLRKNFIEQAGLQICKRRVLKVRKASKFANNTARRKFYKSFYKSCLMSGIDIHLGPPLPRDSSELGIT